MKMLRRLFGKNAAGHSDPVLEEFRPTLVDAIRNNKVEIAKVTYDELCRRLSERHDELVIHDMSECLDSVMLTIIAVNALENLPGMRIYATGIGVVRIFASQQSNKNNKSKIKIGGVLEMLRFIVGLMEYSRQMDEVLGSKEPSFATSSPYLSVFAEHLLMWSPA